MQPRNVAANPSHARTRARARAQNTLAYQVKMLMLTTAAVATETASDACVPVYTFQPLCAPAREFRRHRLHEEPSQCERGEDVNVIAKIQSTAVTTQNRVHMQHTRMHKTKTSACTLRAPYDVMSDGVECPVHMQMCVCVGVLISVVFKHTMLANKWNCTHLLSARWDSLGESMTLMLLNAVYGAVIGRVVNRIHALGQARPTPHSAPAHSHSGIRWFCTLCVCGRS